MIIYRTLSQIALLLTVESAICDRGYYIPSRKGKAVSVMYLFGKVACPRKCC
jgi:hypothetical protein